MSELIIMDTVTATLMEKFDALKSEIEIINIQDGTVEHPEIKNRPVNLSEYDSYAIDHTPVMTGKLVPAMHEVHIFMTPLWIGTEEPDKKIIEKYHTIVKLFNEIMHDAYPDFKIMKSPVLALNFKDVGYVTVMQSSLYVLTDDKKFVINMAHQVAEIFKFAGFNVVREKIEASIYGINGIPQTTDEMLKYDDKYFEYHIRVQRKSDDVSKPLTVDEISELETISNDFTTKFNTPVPLSYNRSKQELMDDSSVFGGYQRYLNVRFRHIGAVEACKFVSEITNTINETTSFKVVKVISEYVWYDTYTGMDKGWIDF